VASGLLETVREVGAVIGVAAVSTVLVSSSGSLSDTFHAAYWVVVVTAGLGALAAASTYPRATVVSGAPATEPTAV
jgi:flagellar motor component MotA